VGASDNLAGGESTFLVEMNEAANILNNATHRSLILLDEIGRGTSTFDGLSIAWAMAEYLHEEPSVAAKTLFATHYHELNELAERYPRIVNANVSVKEHKGAIIFLRKLVEGGADHSYGIQVAALAGLPAPVLHRAREILQSLETQELSVDKARSSKPQTGSIPTAAPVSQMALFGVNESTSGQFGLSPSVTPAEEALLDKMKALEMERLSPIDAFQLLLELKQSLGHEGQSNVEQTGLDHGERNREERNHGERE
jgi:DNA mismatch repair protein MutS